MARNPHNRAAWRSLSVLMAIALAMIIGLASAVTWAGAQWTVKLGLDLEGGTQMVLAPQVREGETVSAEQLAQAVDIMRARVDGQGVAEAEVATLGSNVVVAVPGAMSKAQEDALRQSSQMRFRPVLAELPTEEAPAPTPSGSPSAAPSGAPSGSPNAVPSGAASAKPGAAKPGAAKPSAAATPTANRTSANGVAPQALKKAPVPAATGAPTPAPTEVLKAPKTKEVAPGLAALTPEQWKDPKKRVEYATSEAWLSAPQYVEQIMTLDCKSQQIYNPAEEDTTVPAAVCDASRPVKYLLGPSVLNGDQLADATSGPATNDQGQPTGGYKVDLATTPEARDDYGAISAYMVGLDRPRNQLAVVLDNKVISAPYFSNAIRDGRAEISGDFTVEESQMLADQLKFGALPISFTVQSAEQISPTVGGDQLQKGLIAGAIGLFLVVLYSLAQYRALGLVTVSSLIIVAILTYLALTLFGWGYNLRLTMAGVTGAIVAIGTTADSFIVYFERVRDEVRDGRSLPSAVEAGWDRAKRTILISDGVNLLAAVVLYVLAASNVRGFAFVLILTTVLDLIVVFLFTHPLLSILSRTDFFSSGHPWSGFSAETLGVSGTRYRGRGRFARDSAAHGPVQPEESLA
ncbi:protein translocase subunit SecD [Gephyromycinifex aptenodytis]|uniref:protein translocase subunit SecD n=1 Tax=Gephyromycinifex aptenodytis TaxID=2716227 RepID=UPI001D01FE9E|nr:protein translocase subunit SecD [Gephyromycinifex aptenodytis]